MSEKLLRMASFSMCSSLENYLHEVADSMESSEPKLTELEVLQALQAVSDAVEEAAKNLKIS